MSQILAGLERAWWLLWSVPAVPMAPDPADWVWQLAIGATVVLVLSALVLTGRL